jgi:hypothetical protein
VAIEVLLWLWGARGRHGLNVQLWLGSWWRALVGA